MPLSPLGGTLDTAPAFATPTFDINPRPLSPVSAPNLASPATFKAGDRIKDTAASVTSGIVTLNKANPAGFSNFKDGVGDGNATFYVLADTSGNWEAQYGFYADAAGTLTRSAVPLSSSTTPGVQVTFSGAVTVFGNWPAAAEVGQILGLQPGRFYSTTAWSRSNGSANTLPKGSIVFAPVFVGQPFSAFTLYTRSGGNSGPAPADVGLYSNVNGGPYALLGKQTGVGFAPGGDLATSPIAAPQPLASGLYWVGLLPQQLGGLSIFCQTSGAGGPFMGSNALNDTTTYGYVLAGQAQLPSFVPQAALGVTSQAPVAGVGASF